MPWPKHESLDSARDRAGTQRLRGAGKGDFAKRVRSSVRSLGVVAHPDGALAPDILAGKVEADDEQPSESAPVLQKL